MRTLELRPILALGVFAVASTVVLCAQAPPTPAAPAPAFSFDGQTFVRVSMTPTKTGFMEEYLPVGQALSHWTAMASIHHLNTAVADPVAATHAVADAVRRANPDAQILIMNNAATGNALVDFVTWPVGGAGNPPFFEYDICKYRKASDGGLIAFQYARRAYGADEQPFVQNLKTERQRLLPLMGTTDFNPR
jgi:hypothetical protein